jgi:hypothetical protein
MLLSAGRRNLGMFERLPGEHVTITYSQYLRVVYVFFSPYQSPNRCDNLYHGILISALRFRPDPSIEQFKSLYGEEFEGNFGIFLPWLTHDTYLTQFVKNDSTENSRTDKRRELYPGASNTHPSLARKEQVLLEVARPLPFNKISALRQARHAIYTVTRRGQSGRLK